MSSQRRDRAISRPVKIRCNLSINNLDCYAHVAQDPPKPRYEILSIPAIFLHAEQKPMQYRIVAGLQPLIGKDVFVCCEQRG
jgi:hypothetical protein